MNDTFDLLTEHWLSLVLLVFTLVLAMRACVVWMRRRRWQIAPCMLAASFLCLAIGELLIPAGWAFWIGVAALATLFVMTVVLVISGGWSAYLGYAAGAGILLGLGGTAVGPIGGWLAEAGKSLKGLEPTQPWWLLLLVFVPVVIWLSYRSLAGLGPVRRWLAIGLRCALIVLLTLALAEVRIRHQSENVTVFFVVDRSFSIPAEYDSAPSSETTRVDRRWERVEKFINEAVRQRGPDHKADRAGLILFGRRPRLELPASNAPSFNFRFKDA